MPDTIGNSEHYDKANIETERAFEREGGPELSAARPSNDMRDFQMPPVPEEIEGLSEEGLTEPRNAQELEEARNPLGYNASEATREEMDAAGR